MKNKLTLLAAGLGIFSLLTTQCTALDQNKNNHSSTGVTVLQREWMATKIGSHGKDELMKAKANLTFNKLGTKEATVNAYAGCNRMFGAVKFSGTSTLSVPNVQSTMMYCDGLMDLEMDYAKILKQVNRYEVKGHELYLYQNNTLLAQFVAADWD